MLEKTFDPKSIEEKHYKDWEESGVFACDPNSDKTPFTVMMPPPNVTGSLHIGHALNATLHDILVRWNRMNGKDALWQPGLDHAGIATQAVVEKKLAAEGITRKELGREEFVKRVWDWKEESGGTIINQFKRLGTTPDWDRERFTMDEGMSKAVIKVFVQLHKEGLIYRDNRLVNWDPKLQTAVSDLEVEHREIKGKFYHFQYPFEDGSGHLSIATTRPETILADGAVAVNPDDERYKHLVGKNVVVPVINRIIPIIADEHVKADFGSGCVKITAAHDFNDFEVYKRHKDKGIPLINLFTKDGKMNENCPKDYQGLDRFEARKKVIADFEELDYLEKIETHVNKVPYSERSGAVIEPYLTEQWYCDAETLAKPAIEAVETGKTTFYPKSWENTYFEWMRNIQPWCISRQLWWGHQIPAWYDNDGNIFVAANEADAQEQAGEGVELRRDEDVLDTWFSSALFPFSTLGWPDKGITAEEVARYYPGDVLITGFDIIFFWVARMMMMGIHFMGDVPFKDVYMHALVRDASGAKMSKSKGNVIDPLDLCDEFGADAVRFTLCAMAAQGRDIKLSEDRVIGYRNFSTKLWNATRYCEINNCMPQEGFDPSAVDFSANQWIISEVTKTKTTIDEAIKAYKFNEAADAIYQFTWGTFCDWYLEFSKPFLQEDSDGAIAAEIRGTTGWVLDQILTLLNPFMPYITEELYASIAKRAEGERLISANWPTYDAALNNEEAGVKMDWLISFISEVRSVRADMNVPAGAKIKLLVKDACDDVKAGLKAYDEILRRMARLESIELTDTVPKGSIQAILGQTTLIMPIADIIDLDKESARLRKEMDTIDGEISKIENKLSNEKFVSNAPKEIIEEQHTRKTTFLATREKLDAALKQLEAA